MRPTALHGRAAFVTGSGQGIGQATATLVAGHGATAVFLAFDKTKYINSIELPVDGSPHVKAG